jgi:4-hydroxybenzoate polyprenyltransferase
MALALLRACHPEPTAAVTAVSVALAVSVGRGLAGTLAVAAAVLVGQLSVGCSNDYLDRDRDVQAGRGDKPVAVGRVQAETVGTAAVVAALATVPLSMLSGLPAGTLHVLAVASAWSYNLRLKSTAVSVLPYAVSFGLLPAFVTAGMPGHPVVGWLVAAGALLGSGAHFANVLPDLDDDLRTGVRGLPHRIGGGASRVTAAVLLLAASAVLAFGPPGPPGRLGVGAVAVAAVVGLGGLVAGRRPGSRAAFRAVLLVAAVDVLLLLGTGHKVR